MKVAVIYNRDSQKVINPFGVPNREKYGVKAIRRILDSLKKGGHQAIAMEGDKDLIDNLEEFMPRALKGERPGMAFNLSYGIQGQARYTHVPGILEMVGVPYVGSGPLAHSLALDKVVAKMIFVQQGIPTPEFAVVQAPGFPLPELEFPLIVKPKNEAVSFGIKVVHNEEELREASDVIFSQFQQPVLIERYLDGREINVGLIGNGAQLETFPPAELLFGDAGPKIYTLEDKKRTSGREVSVSCPADLDEETSKRACEVARAAFEALGCYDCARVDLRLRDDGEPCVLEINSLPSLGEHGSYVAAAEVAGLDFPGLINRLVEVAAARYFGTPNPPQLGRTKEAPESAFAYLTRNRDRLERRVAEWVALRSPSDDAVSLRQAASKVSERLKEVGLREVAELTDRQDVWTWESAAGLEGGTLLIVHLDVPNANQGRVHFHRDPEWLYGEGVGSSRAALAQLEFSLRALRHVRRLARTRLGVLCYADEGRDCEESTSFIERAAKKAGRVLVLSPGQANNRVVSARGGLRRFRLSVEGKPIRIGQLSKSRPVLDVLWEKLGGLRELSERRQRASVAVAEIRSESYPMRLPHRAVVSLQLSYRDVAVADELEGKLQEILRGEGLRWDLTRVSVRPPMVDRKGSRELLSQLGAVAERWEIPLGSESSPWPSAAGLVPAEASVVCGLGPVSSELFTHREAVSRISLVQRTLLLTQFLLGTLEGR